MTGMQKEILTQIALIEAACNHLRRCLAEQGFHDVDHFYRETAASIGVTNPVEEEAPKPLPTYDDAMKTLQEWKITPEELKALDDGAPHVPPARIWELGMRLEQPDGGMT